MRGRYLKGNKLQADYASHECRAAFFEQCKNSGMDMKERSKPWEIHQPHLTAPNENSNSPDSTYRYSQIFYICFLGCHASQRQLDSSRNQLHISLRPHWHFLYIVPRLCVAEPVGREGLVSPADHVGFVLRNSCQAVFRIAHLCCLKSFSVFFLSFLS